MSVVSLIRLQFVATLAITLGITVLNSLEQLELRRWPDVAHDQLRAWDAADEYLLQHIRTLTLPASPRILVLNDNHGALSTALHSLSPVNWSDSWMSHQAAIANAKRNSVNGTLTCLPSTEDISSQFDLVVIRVPKTTALLDDQLSRVRAHVNEHSHIVAGAMLKHLQKSAFSCFEKHIGPVTTSLAQKKSRLLFAQLDVKLPTVDTAYPTVYSDPDLNFELINHANVFSRERLDHGARLLLQQFSKLPLSKRAIDLACGNGVLGIRLQQIQPDVLLEFIDESYQAIRSAKDSYARCFTQAKLLPGRSEPVFSVVDGLMACAANSVDLVVCNPPFHQQHVVDDQIALTLFNGAKRCLQQKGQLWVVANRHLGYQPKLKRLFGNCRIVNSNRKFHVLQATKR